MNLPSIFRQDESREGRSIVTKGDIVGTSVLACFKIVGTLEPYPELYPIGGNT